MQILAPCFAMAALTLFSIFRLGDERVSAVKNRRIDWRFFLLYRDYDEPEDLTVASRNLVNQFEVPVLFYVSSILAYVTGQGTAVLVGLSWLYVVARYIHSYIHLTTNRLIWRFRVFAFSCLVLLAIWIVLGLQLLLS